MTTTKTATIPAGFRTVAARMTIARWEAGAVMHAVFLSITELKTKYKTRARLEDQLAFRAKLLNEYSYTTDDGEVIRIPAGEEITAPLPGGLNGLQALPEGSEVFINCLGKAEIEGNRTAWRFELATR